tara:strand:- start:1490 stop:1924 length:435 start_codon:yes stop_codon:yes gene_type:complete
MASGLYGITFLNALKNDLALDLDDTTADRFKAMLVTSSYTPDFGTHDFKSDVTNEVSGTGYDAGGKSLSSVTFTQSGGTITFDAANVTWTSSTITARGAVIYDDSLTNDPLIAYIDFGSDKSSSAGDFVLSFNASGIFTLDLTP